MTTDITNFINIHKQKNGAVKINHGEANESNIYKLLYDFGYRRSRLDDELIYFRSFENDLNPVLLLDIKHAFLNFLSRGDYTNCPKDISREDILDWYYSRNPIRENRILISFPEYSLPENEAHLLRIKTNPYYKRSYESRTLVSNLGEWGFSKAVDNIGSYKSNNPSIYYKRLINREFLVFSHNNTNLEFKDSFDCWIATYYHENQIGLKKPIDLREIRLGFLLERDLPLIINYLS